jgi:hypothetical protein
MYKTKCSNPKCEKEVYTYATSRTGKLQASYCSKVCEANTKYDKRFVEWRKK